MNILIAGYVYIKENYFKTFAFYPEPSAINFLLPKTWKAKDGKIIFQPPNAENVYVSRAYFYHSHYPLIGGLLKGWLPAFPFVLRRLKRAKKLTIVFSPSEPILLTTLYQAFWSKLFGLKHIIFTWENISYENKFKGLNLLCKKIIIKLTIALSDGIVCGNHKAEEICKRLTKKQTAVIPLSGVDVDFFRPVNGDRFLNTYNLHDKLIFSYAGAIGYRKGIHILIQAFQNVVLLIPNVHIVIAGSGEYEKEISELITELNLQEHITRIPWLNRVGLRELLSVSHVFVHPSLVYAGWEEQFGYSMAEASAMELPVISTSTGSIEEVVVDGTTGLLVKPNDKASLEEAMIRLGLDLELRKNMGCAGRQHIIQHFSYKIVAEKFYEFFKKVNLHR